jgi:hypothetical protein
MDYIYRNELWIVEISLQQERRLGLSFDSQPWHRVECDDCTYNNSIVNLRLNIHHIWFFLHGNGWNPQKVHSVDEMTKAFLKTPPHRCMYVSVIHAWNHGQKKHFGGVWTVWTCKSAQKCTGNNNPQGPQHSLTSFAMSHRVESNIYVVLQTTTTLGARGVWCLLLLLLLLGELKYFCG